LEETLDIKRKNYCAATRRHHYRRRLAPSDAMIM